MLSNIVTYDIVISHSTQNYFAVYHNNDNSSYYQKTYVS